MLVDCCSSPCPSSPQPKSNVAERARNLSSTGLLGVSSGDPGAPREPLILLGSAFFHGLMFSAVGCLVVLVLNQKLGLCD